MRTEYLKADLPSMFTAAPIRDKKGQAVAVLGLRIRPEEDFTGILQVASSGATGETYAFDDKGLFLSGSRFEQDLKQAGLLADTADTHSVLTLELRDPGVDMMQGERPAERRASQPLTRMAAVGGRAANRGWMCSATAIIAACRSSAPGRGSRTTALASPPNKMWPKRSVRCTCCEGHSGECLRCWWRRPWRFLPSRLSWPARIGKPAVPRWKRNVSASTRSTKNWAKEAWAWFTERHHAMLHRPTAVKLLGHDKTTEQTLARFEREVQMTSRLNHPNTIAIYDYGRTPEGIFYYAMEYLEGINLEDLVRKHGPQPEGRVIYILQQVCGSLAEAHTIGLIHRDIKPANIILTERGGLYDFAKLLDFGLVKAVDSKKDSSLTSAGSMTGTPLYMAPEAIQHDQIDGRSDLYALGAVGYYLLTGTPVFDGSHVLEILKKHVDQVPDPPSRRLGKPVSAELEAVLLKCLAKNSSDRQQSAIELADELRVPDRGKLDEKRSARVVAAVLSATRHGDDAAGNRTDRFRRHAIVDGRAEGVSFGTSGRVEHLQVRRKFGYLALQAANYLGRGFHLQRALQNFLGRGLVEMAHQFLDRGNERRAHAEAPQAHAEQQHERARAGRPFRRTA